MIENCPSITPDEIIDEETTFTLVELCRSCDIDAAFIEDMVEQGILEPTGKRGSHWCFPSTSLRRTQVTLHLKQDLGVNLAGAALALDLLERIDELHAKLHTLGYSQGDDE